MGGRGRAGQVGGRGGGRAGGGQRKARAGQLLFQLRKARWWAGGPRERGQGETGLELTILEEGHTLGGLA